MPNEGDILAALTISSTDCAAVIHNTMYTMNESEDAISGPFWEEQLTFISIV